MKNLRKITLLCLTLTMVATASLAVACGGGSDNSSSSSPADSSSVPFEGEDPGYTDTYPEAGHGGSGCTFGEWELVQDATCTVKGAIARYCTEDESHVDYDTFAARGHNYGNTGVCVTCETVVSVTPPPEMPYLNPDDPNDGIQGAGEDYDRYLFYVDEYYEIEMGSENIWFEFPVDGPGQYAVVSTSNPGGVEIARYDASAHYITDTPYPGRELEDGNFISTAHCAENLWSRSWTATFRLDGSDGDIVRFYITKIADAAWMPTYVTVDVEATELNGKAPEGAEGTTPADVPYDSDYFYDEESGYYRMGSEANPGEIIYAAITESATRLMGEMSFSGLPEAGASISLDGGTTIEGNYLVYNYAPFMYSDPNYGGSENSYQAFVNDDGLHPVTKELHDFLALYVSKNAPATPPEKEFEDNAWLAPCYYYANLTPGSEAFPIEITTLGAFQAVPYEAFSQVYYTFRYTPAPDADANPDAPETSGITSYCTITIDTDKTKIWIGDTSYQGKGVLTIPFEVSSTTGVIISFLNQSIDEPMAPIDVTIALLKGTSDNPIELTELGEVALSPIEILTLSGEKVYRAYYSYTATQAGTISLSTSSKAQILLNDTTITGDSASVSVEAGDVVTVYVDATSTEPVSVTLSQA